MRKIVPFAFLSIFVVAVQVTTTLSDSQYFLTQLIMAAWYTLVVVGLCFLMGYAGQISLGHAAFFACGGYTTAVLSTMNLLPYKDGFFVKIVSSIGLTIPGADIWGSEVLYLSPWLSLLAATGISGIVAFVIGIPVLRLKGHYLAMATLGFGTIVYRIVLGTPLFGGADGLSSVPAFEIFPGLIIDGSGSHRLGNYYFAWGVLILALVLVSNLINSRAGRALRALHGNEDAAQAMGVNTAGYKLGLFVLSAVMAAVAGFFMTHYNGGIGPNEAGAMKSVRYVAIVAVGGMANLWGVLISGIVLTFLSLRGYFGSYDDAVFGSVLIVVMLFAPQGILAKRKKDEKALAPQNRNWLKAVLNLKDRITKKKSEWGVNIK